MEQDIDFRKRICDEYSSCVWPLMTYLPWFESHSGRETSTLFGSEGIKENSVSFPVYDATLMHFVRTVEKTTLMDRNYRYVYSRNHLDSHEAERIAIHKATWKEWGMLKGILSRYVMGGRTKGRLWSEAVREDIFLLVLLQMKEIAEGLGWQQPEREG